MSIDQKESYRLERKLDDFIRKSSNNDTSTSKDIEYIKETISKIERSIADSYITKSEFEPIKKIVYGVVTLILTAVVTGILAIVIK